MYSHPKSILKLHSVATNDTAKRELNSRVVTLVMIHERFEKERRIQSFDELF